jgi:hypothetical protein
MMKPTKRNVLVCALCTLAVALSSGVCAEDSAIPAAPLKAAFAPADYKGPVEFNGKVMVVNRPEQTVTVEINGKLHLFKVTPQVKILRKGKSVTIQDVAAGQKISVIARVAVEGTLQVVSLGLDAIWTESQPAGRTDNAKGPGGASYPGNPSQGKVPPPFQNGQYPGHVEKVVVSPNQ